MVISDELRGRLAHDELTCAGMPPSSSNQSIRGPREDSTEIRMTAALPVDQQERILTNAGFDPNTLLDPTKLKQFINQFLANAQIANGANGSSAADVALAALTNGQSALDGIVPLNLSFLQTPVTGTSGSGSSTNGALVNLFT